MRLQWGTAISVFLWIIIGLFVYWLDLGRSHYYYENDYNEGNEFSDPEISMHPLEIIEHHGYKGEKHSVLTDDGYILEFHRIPFCRTCRKAYKGPVLLLHGLFCTSSAWLLNNENQSLAFVLSKAGYDVWLLNSRGTVYSRNHLNLSSHGHDYWKFSWDDMALYDVPAAIDYVLDTTNSSQLFLMGFSMGTTISIGTLSEKPEYNSKVKAFIGLSPVFFMNNVRGWFFDLFEFLDFLGWMKPNYFGFNQVLAQEYFRKFIGLICQNFVKPVCARFLSLIMGPSGAELNITRIPVYFAHYPHSGNVLPITHFKQVRDNKRAAYFDWGKQINIVKYGQAQPPPVDISRVTAPTMIFHSEGDYISDPKDVEYLIKQLPNVVVHYSIKNEPFSHFDFMFGKNANDVLYSKVIHFMSDFDSGIISHTV